MGFDETLLYQNYFCFYLSGVMSEDWTTKKIDKYVVVNKKLGSGTYGVVYRGFHLHDESK